MSDSNTNKSSRKFPLLPQQLMYEFLHALQIRIGGIPEQGYYFHSIPNLRRIFAENGRSMGLVERVKSLDLRGEKYIRELLDSIIMLDEFVNPHTY